MKMQLQGKRMKEEKISSKILLKPHIFGFWTVEISVHGIYERWGKKNLKDGGWGVVIEIHNTYTPAMKKSVDITSSWFKGKRFHCIECDVKFTQQYALNKHIKVLSVPEFTANLYCICLSIDMQYT